MDNLPSRAEMREMMRIRPALPKGRRRAMEEEDERYNPISPANGNIIMRGGAVPPMSSRTPRLSMADSRALEIQQRHETPGTGGVPSSGVSQMRGGAMERMVGGSATPSMGLSMFRGGDLATLLDSTNVSRSGRTEGQGHLRQKSMPPVEMRGGKHYRDGHALSTHLQSTISKPNHKKLIEGMLIHSKGIHGGGWFADTWRKIKNELANPQSKLRGKIVPAVINEIRNPRSKLRGEYIPAAERGLQFLAPALDVAGNYVGVPGAGQTLSQGARNLQQVNQRAAAIGLGRQRGGKHLRSGHSLSEHLLHTLGKAAHKKLLEGVCSQAVGLHGGAWWDFLDPNKNGFNASLADTKRKFEDFGKKVENEFVNPQSILRQKVLNPVANEFTDKDSILRGKVLPGAQKVLKVAAPFIDAAGAAVGVPMAGQLLSRGADVLQGVNQGARALGYGRCGGKKRRAPASAGDGRRKRAEIVRRLMNERGISMIEASKAVKAEGLY